MSQRKLVDFSPWHELQRMARSAWFLVLTIILGAIGGGLVHQFIPPVYEARSVMTVLIDYTRTGYLEDYQQDQVMEAVGDLVAATDVKRHAAELAGWPQDAIQSGAYLEHFFVERQYFKWIMRVRSADAELAATAANAWASETSQSINEGLEHAILAGGLERYQYALEKCLEQIALVEPVQAYCSVDNLAELQSELESTAKDLRDERVLSKGLIPAITYEVNEKAVVPNAPVARGRNTLILAGMAVGMGLGVLGLAVDLPARFLRRRDQ